MIALSWLTSQAWFRKVVVVLGLVVAVLFALAGMRRKAEQTGKLIEREHQREEIRKAEKRMDEVVRPSSSDVRRRVRDGTF